MTTMTKDGYTRRVFNDGAYWTIEGIYDNDEIEEWQYDVARYPFVPGYHIIRYDSFERDATDSQKTIISTHKTLAEALNIVRVLLASGGIRYE